MRPTFRRYLDLCLSLKDWKLKQRVKSDSPWVPGSIPFVLNISLSQKGSDAESRTVKRLVRFFSSYTNFFWRSQGSLFGPLILLVTTAESHWSSWLLSIFIEKSWENHLLPQCADDNRLILISWFYTYFKSFQRLCFAVVFKRNEIFDAWSTTLG